MSIGKADILETKNGLNKFVMQKEMERQEKLLEEEKKVIVYLCSEMSKLIFVNFLFVLLICNSLAVR